MIDEKENEESWKRLIIALKQTCKSKGLTNSDIAERTGFQRSNVSRLFSMKYSPSIKNFIKISQAAGLAIDLVEIDKVLTNNDKV